MSISCDAAVLYMPGVCMLVHAHVHVVQARGGGGGSDGLVTEAMDIFSAGCCIAEVFLEGNMRADGTCSSMHLITCARCTMHHHHHVACTGTMCCFDISSSVQVKLSSTYHSSSRIVMVNTTPPL